MSIDVKCTKPENINNKKISVKGIPLENEITRIDEYVREFYYSPDPLNAREYEKALSANGQDTDNKVIEDMLNVYFQTDETLRKNTDLKTVLAKVTLLNSHYKTMIKNIDLVAVARHILSIENFDKRLCSIDGKPDLQLVNDIACIKNKFNTMNNIYSFASKYCAWHHPDKFPIVDSYTKGMLYYINRDTGFYDKKFTQKDLKNYSEYYHLYTSFINFLKSIGVENKSFKEIDIFLWRFGLLHNIKL